MGTDENDGIIERFVGIGVVYKTKDTALWSYISAAEQAPGSREVALERSDRDLSESGVKTFLAESLKKL